MASRARAFGAVLALAAVLAGTIRATVANAGPNGSGDEVSHMPTSPAEAGPSDSPADDFALAAAGRVVYKTHCAHCHGPNMVNPGTISFDLRKFPHDDRARFFNSVKSGKGGMPAWKEVLSDEEIAQLFAYVLSGGK